jgi:hypothetical protein
MSILSFRENFQKVLKKNLNNLKLKDFFTPSFLIYTIIACTMIFYIASDIKWSFDNRIFFLIATSILILTKTFIVSFHNFNQSVKNKKWPLFVFDTFAIILVTTIIFAGVNFLKETTFPLNTFLVFSISSVVFYLQSTLGGLKLDNRINIAGLLFYASIYLILNLRPFNLDVQQVHNTTIKFIELVSISSVLLEFVIFVLTAKTFLNKTR